MCYLKAIIFWTYTNNQQWQIQYFPEECINSKGSINLLFGIIFAKNYIKMKKRRHVPYTPQICH